MPRRPPPCADEVLLASVGLARAALLEVTPAQTVGSVLGHVVEDEHVLTVLFAADLAGYPGWRWSVTIARVDDAAPTVLETELMPGDTALLAPEWVPWSERLADYRAAQEAIAAAAAEAGEGDAESDDGLSDDGIDEEELDLDDEYEDDLDLDHDDDDDTVDEFDGVDIDALDDSAPDDDADDAADDDIVELEEDVVEDQDARRRRRDDDDDDEDARRRVRRRSTPSPSPSRPTTDTAPRADQRVEPPRS